MPELTTLLSSVCLLLGAFLIFSGGLGVLRFPDFFTRMHAAGVTETMAATLIVLGLMLHSGWGLPLFKLLFILLFVMITGPTASHALAKSALHGGLRPQGDNANNERH